MNLPPSADMLTMAPPASSAAILKEPSLLQRASSTISRLGLLVGMAGIAIAFNGCSIGKLIGGMAESHRRTTTRTVAAEYTGLEGKSFAVVVYADRVLQGNQPQLVPRLTNVVTAQLAQPERTGVTGFVPMPPLLEFQLSRPDWITWTYQQLAEEFGVDRLVVIEVVEYRLNDPGNSYLWNGIASGTVGVAETDGSFPNELTFRKDIRVRFPDQDGLGPNEFSNRQVRSMLERRFVDRVSWLFYEHQEPYYPEY